MDNTDALISKTNCGNCNAEISTEKFCTRCGFPANGTDEEKTQYKGRVYNTKLSLKEAQEKIDKAKLIIYLLAGLEFIFAMVYGFGKDDIPTMIVELIVCVLYLILAVWANKNPFGAILTCFIVYLTLQVIRIVVEPATIFSGILWKILIIGGFIKGLQSASEAQKLIKEINQYKGREVGAD